MTWLLSEGCGKRVWFFDIKNNYEYDLKMIEVENLRSENTRLRQELKINKGAYTHLQKEKDEIAQVEKK